MKPMPVCAIDWAICSGCRLILTPSESSTSALPDEDETLRPPCLATRAPAAAATNIEAVEILKVCAPSPPVPTMSSRLVVSAMGTLVENSRITCAAAAISPGFLFHAQAHGERRDHGGGHFAGHDLAEQVQHFVVKDFAVFDAAQQGFLWGDRHDASFFNDGAGGH